MGKKKRTKEEEEHFQQIELTLEEHETSLKLREQREEEERKKKAEEEEEFKFDFQALIAEQNKKSKVNSHYSHLSERQIRKQTHRRGQPQDRHLQIFCSGDRQEPHQKEKHSCIEKVKQ